MHRAPATALAIVVGASLVAALTHAQSGMMDVIVVGPGGLCLSVGAGHSHLRPPPDGTPLVLAACDGSDAQRFWRCVGDCDEDLQYGDQAIVSERGRAVVRRRAHPTAILRDGAVRFWMGRGNGPSSSSTLSHCLTAAMPPSSGVAPRTRPCDGSAAQAFSSR